VVTCSPKVKRHEALLRIDAEPLGHGSCLYGPVGVQFPDDCHGFLVPLPGAQICLGEYYDCGFV
jgi:hypothetical protein